MNVLSQRYFAQFPIAKLQTHPRNARQGDAGAIHQSIEQNGFYGSVLVQKSTGYVLAGNHRYLVAKSMGAETIPVIVVDCDDSVGLRIMLCDNRTSDLGSYDMSALSDLLESVRMDMGLEGTGWDDDSYLNLLDDLKGITLGELSGPPASEKKTKAPKDEIVKREVFDGPNPTKKTAEPAALAPEAAPLATRFQVLVDCSDELQQTTVLGMLESGGYSCRKLG